MKWGSSSDARTFLLGAGNQLKSTAGDSIFWLTKSIKASSRAWGSMPYAADEHLL